LIWCFPLAAAARRALYLIFVPGYIKGACNAGAKVYSSDPEHLNDSPASDYICGEAQLWRLTAGHGVMAGPFAALTEAVQWKE
jgi:hypothetical protein